MEGGARALAEEIVVPIRLDSDIVAARQQGRALASRVGFSSGEATLIAASPSSNGGIISQRLRGLRSTDLQRQQRDASILIRHDPLVPESNPRSLR